MARTILITSGKGGVGKTTSAINLAAALNLLGKKTLLIDSSLSADVGIHLGAPTVPISLNSVLAGKSKASEAIYKHSSGLLIMPSSLNLHNINKVKLENLVKVIGEISRYAEFIIIDCAAGLGDEVLYAINASNEIIVVTNAEMPAIANALKILQIARARGKIINGVIITKHGKHKNELSLENIHNFLEERIIGIVPEDEAVSNALAQREILVHSHPRSKAAISYKKIAAKLVGNKFESDEGFIEEDEKTKENKGFFERLFNWINF